MAKKISTYDVVMNPSHANAKILEYLPEDFVDMEFGSPVFESSDLEILTSDDINLNSMTFTNDSIYESLFNDSFETALRGLRFNKRR